MMKTGILAVAIAAMMFNVIAYAGDDITVYKSATCGCCNKWINHLEQNGFKVKGVDVDNVIPYKIKYGLTPRLASCHTAVIEGYTIEGHVPAKDIRRLLKEKPDLIGLSVPQMPVGTPGMEQGNRKDPYQVIGWDKNRKESVFTDYQKY